jgi:hypothetical protein
MPWKSTPMAARPEKLSICPAKRFSVDFSGTSARRPHPSLGSVKNEAAMQSATAPQAASATDIELVHRAVARDEAAVLEFEFKVLNANLMAPRRPALILR